MSIIFDRPWETMGGFKQGPLVVPLASIGAGINFIGSMQQVAAVKAAGQAQQQNAYYQAKQMEVNAGQERASAQRGMIEANRKRDLALSRATAINAAGGGSGFDILNILTGLKSEGDYEASAQMYQGEDAARGLESQAAATRYEGDVAYKSAKVQSKGMKMAAVANLAKSAGGTLMDKYAPKTETWASGQSFRTR